MLSVTSTVKLDVPVVVGIPLMIPVAALNKRPAGKVPPMSRQFVYGGTPPLAVSVNRYDEPTVAAGSGKGVVTVRVPPPPEDPIAMSNGLDAVAAALSVT
jgi:hypothetical protein